MSSCDDDGCNIHDAMNCWENEGGKGANNGSAVLNTNGKAEYP